jgi:hypothetical protein
LYVAERKSLTAGVSELRWASRRPAASTARTETSSSESTARS